MTSSQPHDKNMPTSAPKNGVVKQCVAVAMAATFLTTPATSFAQESGVDLSKWSPEYVREIAGTQSFDAAGECSNIVPLDYTGRVTYWWVGPNQASPEVDVRVDAEFWAAFAETYPNINVEKQNLDYNQMIDKLRTSALGRAAPMVAKLPILWGVEFAAKGQLTPLEPEDLGYSSSDFWPGAMKSVTWQGDVYGVPTNNETMALIWNADLFEKAGLDPEMPPQTWDELVEYSNQIKEKTGKNGYGLVARVNAGNTPFRFMPQLWANGSGALDEAESSPTYGNIMINNEGGKAALQAAYNMYVRDQSVPVSALTNTQTENQDPFITGQLAMMISHPTEYAKMLDRAANATGSDKEMAENVVSNMRYGLIPAGTTRRAVVFGGSNAHIFNADVVDGELDMQASKALICMMTSPEWATRLHWANSNPGNLRGFTTEWMAQRLDEIKFLDVTTSMLPSGVPFPVIPESTEIMNIIVPEMLQNVLTEKMSIDEAADEAAAQIQSVLDGM